MNRYSVNGLGHRMMSRLEGGPVFFADLIPLAAHRSRPKDHARHVLEALRRDGLVRLGSAGYTLTTDGLAALEDLNEQAAPPSVRIFGMRAHA